MTTTPTEERPPPRAVIRNVRPELDCGRFPIKRTPGEKVVVAADVFSDGHELLTVVLLYKTEKDSLFNEVRMTHLENDRWTGEFQIESMGRYSYTIEAWVDGFRTWRDGLSKKIEAGLVEQVDLLVGADLVSRAAERATAADSLALEARAGEMIGGSELEQRANLAMDPGLEALMERWPDRSNSSRYVRLLKVVVDVERARFGAWYELFPRSCSRKAGHGTFADCKRSLEYVASMGFDVLYLPPVHPIGVTYRKGKNNETTAGPRDVGSPWAIGSREGGHTAIHPDLGTIDDFEKLIARASELSMAIAIDIAWQCSPDHPWVSEHPEWFRCRPDGTIQYAENPPKKYQDIYPLEFENENWRALWNALLEVVLYWIDHGVRIFRVDNPHTKPFPFWEWLISEVRKRHADVIFLAEAFTRPNVMYQLAKLGFSQSYTYFTWRNTKWELTEYMRELTQTDVREFFRPSFWPNTPDILPEVLQQGGRAAFQSRLILAATLSSNYGIYGPAYELCVNTPRVPGSEEYLDSEKYELKSWDIDSPSSLRDLVTRVNRIRRESSALQSNETLMFHNIDNDQLIAYTKAGQRTSDLILVIVNLDNVNVQSGFVDLPLHSLGIPDNQPYQVHDLLSDARYMWNGARNYVRLDPNVIPAHIFRVRRRLQTEHDFDHFA